MDPEEPGFSFPKSRRLLKSADFRKVYAEGIRVGGPYFLAFCRPRPEAAGAEPRIGFTAPRALGKAVVRNLIKRRMREAVRLELSNLGSGWDVVFNPRRAAGEAPFDGLRREVDRVFRRCRAS